MSFFTYQDGQMQAEGVPLARIAEQVGTPFYCYSSAALTAAYQAFAAAFSGQPATICYALKANSNQAVIRTLTALGAGADVVSEGELRRALRAGVPASKIVFAGVGKTAAEMAAGLDAGILQFNVESMPELRTLSAVAAARGRNASVSLRINPDVDANTHAKISTGKAENKFGIEFGAARAAFAEAAALPGIEPAGIALHIGSQLTGLEPYRAAFTRMAELTATLRADGHAIRRLDLGGGLGITYGEERPPAIRDYAALVKEVIGPLGCDLILEPGRLLTGNAGVLVTRVIYVKEGTSRSFVIVDAAMNDLIRPALYDAYHAILPVAEPASDAATRRVDIVGPVCESADTFATQRPLPPVAAGDLLTICSAGAYSAVMGSTYNTRLPTPEVMVRGGDYAIVKARPDYDAIIDQDSLPDWLVDTGVSRSRGVA
ncbi:diaminopimelate decarboxylase [Rhodospirillaceae bacterium SYSU D60014]|uniref:diaminopimelate decarboxylase n=1 Tax=Virgifigura deserti TaxID=2268457 RepID=UPI000E667EE8